MRHWIESALGVQSVESPRFPCHPLPGRPTINPPHALFARPPCAYGGTRDIRPRSPVGAPRTGGEGAGAQGESAGIEAAEGVEAGWLAGAAGLGRAAKPAGARAQARRRRAAEEIVVGGELGGESVSAVVAVGSTLLSPRLCYPHRIENTIYSITRHIELINKISESVRICKMTEDDHKGSIQ